MRTRKLPNDRLRALMAEAGLSGAELARAVNARGAELGFSVSYDRSTVSHWLTGTRPRPPAGQLLAGVFSQRLERAVGGIELGLSDVGQGAFPVGGSACRPADDCACASDSARGLTELLGRHQDPVKLRRLRQLAYRRVQLADLVGEGGAGAGRGGPAPAGRCAAVAEIDGVLERYGGGRARELVVARLQEALAGPAFEEAEPAALAAAAGLCRMLGRCWMDELGHGAAQGAFGLALSFGCAARRPVLRALVLRDLSVQALECGQPAEALVLAEAAVGLGGALAGPGGRAYLYGQRGVARAVRGDRCGAFKDIDLAERWADRGDAECGAYPLGALVHQRARIHRAQGDVRRAVSALELSLALRGPAEHRTRALLRIELAELRLVLGEGDGAGELLRLVPSGMAELRSARVAAGVAALRRRVFVPRRRVVAAR